jgi:hypothetical protein
MARAGVGLILSEGARGELFVQEVNPGGPASYEGTIRPGDQIIAVNGVGTLGMKIKDVAPHITGPPMTVVEIIILRQGMQIPIRIQRGAVAPPPPSRPPQSALGHGATGSHQKVAQRLGGDSIAGKDARALAAEAAMKRQVRNSCFKSIGCRPR